MKKSIKNILLVIASLAIITFLYYMLTTTLETFFINNVKNDEIKYNEFGNFVGGIINPFFTLISTFAIIYLTYIIARKEELRNENAIETQRKLNLNQMRQISFENLVQKTNLYVQDFDRVSVYEAKNKFTQMIITNEIKTNSKENSKISVWLIILSELENFILFNFIFSDLFVQESFLSAHSSLLETTSKLLEEQSEFLFVKPETLEKYIDSQKELLSIIGEYIYQEY